MCWGAGGYPPLFSLSLCTKRFYSQRMERYAYNIFITLSIKEAMKTVHQEDSRSE